MFVTNKQIAQIRKINPATRPLRQSAFDLTAEEKALCWICTLIWQVWEWSPVMPQQSCIRLTSMSLWQHILT